MSLHISFLHWFHFISFMPIICRTVHDSIEMTNHFKKQNLIVGIHFDCLVSTLTRFDDREGEGVECWYESNFKISGTRIMLYTRLIDNLFQNHCHPFLFLWWEKFVAIYIYIYIWDVQLVNSALCHLCWLYNVRLVKKFKKEKSAKIYNKILNWMCASIFSYFN